MFLVIYFYFICFYFDVFGDIFLFYLFFILMFFGDIYVYFIFFIVMFLVIFLCHCCVQI